MNWIKRNLDVMGLLAVVALAGFAMWMARNESPSTFRVEMTAHAQKPTESISATGEGGPLTVISGEKQLSAWIEQHCVAVLTEKHDEYRSTAKGSEHPIYVEPAPVVHIPEQALKLRCSEKK